MSNKKARVGRKPAVAKALLAKPKIKLNIIVPDPNIIYVNKKINTRGPDKKPRIRGPNKNQKIKNNKNIDSSDFETDNDI